MNALAMTEDLSNDESYGISIDISIRENKEMLEPTIIAQLVEDHISVDDKAKKLENDDDSIKFNSRSLGLESSSSSLLSSLTSSSDECIIKQQNNKHVCRKGKKSISKINKHRKK